MLFIFTWDGILARRKKGQLDSSPPLSLLFGPYFRVFCDRVQKANHHIAIIAPGHDQQTILDVLRPCALTGNNIFTQAPDEGELRRLHEKQTMLNNDQSLDLSYKNSVNKALPILHLFEHARASCPEPNDALIIGDYHLRSLAQYENFPARILLFSLLMDGVDPFGSDTLYHPVDLTAFTNSLTIELIVNSSHKSLKYLLTEEKTAIQQQRLRYMSEPPFLLLETTHTQKSLPALVKILMVINAGELAHHCSAQTALSINEHFKHAKFRQQCATQVLKQAHSINVTHSATRAKKFLQTAITHTELGNLLGPQIKIIHENRLTYEKMSLQEKYPVVNLQQLSSQLKNSLPAQSRPIDCFLIQQKLELAKLLHKKLQEGAQAVLSGDGEIKACGHRSLSQLKSEIKAIKALQETLDNLSLVPVHNGTISYRDHLEPIIRAIENTHQEGFKKHTGWRSTSKISRFCNNLLDNGQKIFEQAPTPTVSNV